MSRLSIVVEGDGDQGAVPVLVRKYLHGLGEFTIEIAKPINAKGRTKLLREGELERFVSLAAKQRDTRGILVICDADNDPACQLGPVVTTRSEQASLQIPVRACLAVRSYENWLLASHETLAPIPEDPLEEYELVGGVARVKKWLAPGSYVKPLHQPKLTAQMDFELVRSRCPSFARLLRCIDELLPSLTL